MNRVGYGLAIVLAALPHVAGGETYTPGQKINKDFDTFARPFLLSYCVDCHGGTDPAGALSLEELGPLDDVNSGVWKSIWSQVTLKEMPPSDSQQPEVVSRLQFSDWVVGELVHFMRDKGGFRPISTQAKGISSTTICFSARCQQESVSYLLLRQLAFGESHRKSTLLG